MNSSRQSRAPKAFTLIELLVVVLLLALLAALFGPALAGTRTNSKVAQCLNNLRRLTSAWQMYTTDNLDRFPPKLVANVMDWTSSSDNTNTALLVNPAQSPIAGYVRSADLFKCPADNYQNPVNPFPRVMSVSCNAILGTGLPPASVNNQIPGRFYIAKFSSPTQLNKPGPANTLTLLDEHPDSIDDALFLANVGLSTANALWRNLPGSLHGGAGTVSFSDGHAILKRWQDLRTVIPVTYVSYNSTGPHPVPASSDYTWVNDRMPYQ